MASVIKVSGGKTPARAVQFVDADGDRRTIRLGRIGHDMAERFKTRVEQLVHRAAVNETPDGMLSEWLSGLSDKIHDRLSECGLTGARPNCRLGAWLQRYLANRTDLKPATRRSYSLTRDKLLAHFDATTPLRRITVGDAADWELWLRTKGRDAEPDDDTQNAARGLSVASVRVHVRNAKAIFKNAIERELIDKNPFVGLKTGSVQAQGKPYVTLEQTDAILEACPNLEWRVLFGLARYAGLRVPSETHLLTWADIDWNHPARMTVHSPKTERYEGKETRQTPIRPELMAILRDAFESAEPGASRVVTKSSNNLARAMQRILKRAHVSAWPKMFNTLRGACETDWGTEHPAWMAAMWIGNSEAVGKKHYLRIPDEAWEAAAGKSAALGAAPNPDDGAKALQPALQQPAAPSGNDRQECRTDAAEVVVTQGVMQDVASDCDSLPTTPPRTRTWDPLIKNQLPPSVTDAATSTYDADPPTTRTSPSSGAQNPGIAGIQDQQLQTVLEAWPLLPKAVRAAVATMVAAVRHET